MVRFKVDFSRLISIITSPKLFWPKWLVFGQNNLDDPKLFWTHRRTRHYCPNIYTVSWPAHLTSYQKYSSHTLDFSHTWNSSGQTPPHTKGINLAQTLINSQMFAYLPIFGRFLNCWKIGCWIISIWLGLLGLIWSLVRVFFPL